MFDLLRLIEALSRWLNKAAGWALVGMTGLTCADVVLRAFRRPIVGTYELVSFLGAVVIAFALAETTLRRGHVAVEALVKRFPARLQGLIYVVTHLLSLLLFLLIAYECWTYAGDLRKSGEVSLTLKLPFYPVMYGISICALVVCLVLIGDMLLMALRGPLRWYYWEEEG